MKKIKKIKTYQNHSVVNFNNSFPFVFRYSFIYCSGFICKLYRSLFNLENLVR